MSRILIQVRRKVTNVIQREYRSSREIKNKKKGSRARKIHTFLLYGFVFLTADGNRKVGTRGGGGGGFMEVWAIKV
jgi:hypothetical protein